MEGVWNCRDRVPDTLVASQPAVSRQLKMSGIESQEKSKQGSGIMNGSVNWKQLVVLEISSDDEGLN
jgi:hypothetical protein